MKTVARPELDAIKATFEVISTRLFAGRTVVNILADEDPGQGFRHAAGGLEDVYFSTLLRSRRAAHRTA